MHTNISAGLLLAVALALSGCPQSGENQTNGQTPPDSVTLVPELPGDPSFGAADPAWAADSYNADKRIFPNAPANGILTYPWGSGADNYFDINAPTSYWNGKGHNHKYPDLFHFANGNAVTTIKDWESRREEIFNILQYYMHGRMPSIRANVLSISYEDKGNTCTIKLRHASGREAAMTVNHTPPAGAIAGARDNIILFGVGGTPTGRSSAWGAANFNTQWAGNESTRAGQCATLYGLNTGAADTPSINMQYAWAMSVILTVIELGGLNGYYDPHRVAIYGFSRYGKAAMCIGAFAKGYRGSQIAATFVGSAGSGGPAIDRWVNQMGYKNHTEDPLPLDTANGIGIGGGGANSFNDLKGIEWFTTKIADDHNAATAVQVVRGWTTGASGASTPGIPSGAHGYNEYSGEESGSFIRNPGPGYDNPSSANSWGRIQVLSQARSETAGWFSARFMQLQDLHPNAKLDIGSGGVVCTMPFDAHYIAALIAPRVIYYEDGYNTMRNNPEGQWANWLMCDEIYQMYAEELNDPSIIWRNAIKFYDIEHMHYAYQSQDESDLLNAILARQQPNAKFRTPPFPADDPRYRWDFDRMDFGRPGHPPIAERVRRMSEAPAPVKAIDWRGLMDNPDSLTE